MTDLDRKNVIKGLHQHCEGSMFDRCGECPYYEVADEPFRCRDALLMDALVLFREQEPVIVRCKDCKYWHPLFKPDGYCDCDDMWRSLEGETTEVEYIRTNEDFYCGYAEERTVK